MIAIVVVSHSEPLAVAAVELATQMVGEAAPPIEVAAGNDGGLGTDAVAVAAAIERADAASAGTGVLVFTDLGSALLSSEMALELAEDLSGAVMLSRAPFVEGLVAAVVQASIGKSLADVEAEAVRAAEVKSAQLGDRPSGGTYRGEPDASSVQTVPTQSAPAANAVPAAATAPSSVTLDVEIVNLQGLHARPAVLLAKAAAEQSVEVSLTNLDTGEGPAAADSMLELMALGVRQGNTVRLSADGPDAQEALEALARLIAAGLGEGTDDVAS